MYTAHTGLVEAAAPSMVPAATCIPTNTLLIGPLNGIIVQIEGALGGFLFGIVTVIIIFCAVMLVLTVLSKKAQGYLRAMAAVALVPFAVIILLIVYNALIGGFNSAC